MKKTVGYILFALALVACGGNRQSFLMEGDFKGFNQGELYIYSVDGHRGLDTVAVVKGHFRYEIPLEDTTLFVMVFPNFSELPFLGVKGATVKVEGDATHLRETQIEGIKENELMSGFRRNYGNKTPPEMAGLVAGFIKDHPNSFFAPYLVKKYFIQIPQPDYKKAIELTKVIQKARPNTPHIKELIQKMAGLKALKDGGTLPSFTATDVNGKTVKSSDLNAKVNVISVWAKWNFESVGIQRKLTSAYGKHKDDLKVLSICLDADVKECRRKVTKDSVKWSTICDGKIWDTPVMRTLGLSYIPDNIVTDSKGKIIAHSLNGNDLVSQIDKLLPESP